MSVLGDYDEFRVDDILNNCLPNTPKVFKRIKRLNGKYFSAHV